MGEAKKRMPEVMLRISYKPSARSEREDGGIWTTRTGSQRTRLRRNSNGERGERLLTVVCETYGYVNHSDTYRKRSYYTKRTPIPGLRSYQENTDPGSEGKMGNPKGLQTWSSMPDISVSFGGAYNATEQPTGKIQLVRRVQEVHEI